MFRGMAWCHVSQWARVQQLLSQGLVKENRPGISGRAAYGCNT